jgi:hypothetical protein
MSYPRYIDGSRVVYWDDSTGNLTVPGTLTASNIAGVSFSLGSSIQVSSITCSSINTGAIQNGTNIAYANYTDTTVPASDGTLNGVNLTAINQRVHPSLGEQLLFTNSVWIARTPAANRTWRKIAWSPTLKLYCAISDNGLATNNIMTSPDGITWTLRNMSIGINLGTIIWVDSLSRFVALGVVGSSSYSVVSSDGITWTSYPMGDTGWFLEMVWAPQLKRMVAVSWTFPNGKTIAYSSDGITWTQIFPNLPIFTSRWAGITWSPEKGIFVAVTVWEDTGAGNQVMTSPDGIAWTVRSNPGAGKQWYSVAWSPELGLFAAVARSADPQCIMTSSDGINWTLRTSPPHYFTYILWSQELSMFIVTNDGSSPSVTVSRDGVTWTAYNVLPAARRYYGMVWSREQSKLVVLDSSTDAPGSYIVTSEPALPASQNTLLFASPGYASVNNSNGLISMSSMNISSVSIGFLSGAGSITADIGNIGYAGIANLSTNRLSTTETLAERINVSSLYTNYISSGVGSISTLNVNTISSSVGNISSVNTNNVSSANVTTNALNTNILSSAVANISTVNVNTVVVNTINVVSTSIGIMGALSTNAISSAIVATSTLNANTISSAIVATSTLNTNNLSSAIVATSTLNANTISSYVINTSSINTTNISSAVAGISTINTHTFSTGKALIGALNVSSIAGFSPIQVRDALILNSTIITSSLVTDYANISLLKTREVSCSSIVGGIIPPPARYYSLSADSNLVAYSTTFADPSAVNGTPFPSGLYASAFQATKTSFYSSNGPIVFDVDSSLFYTSANFECIVQFSHSPLILNTGFNLYFNGYSIVAPGNDWDYQSPFKIVDPSNNVVFTSSALFYTPLTTLGILRTSTSLAVYTYDSAPNINILYSNSASYGNYNKRFDLYPYYRVPFEAMYSLYEYRVQYVENPVSSIIVSRGTINNIVTSTISTVGGFYVNPVRNGTTTNAVYYDTTTKEFTYGTPGAGIATVSTFNQISSGTARIGNLSVSSINLTNDKVTIGSNAGTTNQGVNAIAIGKNAGSNAQGSNAIAIGFGAGESSQVANSIILNASNSALNATTNAGFYVNPIRNAGTQNVMYYDTTTKELTYGTISTVSTFNSFSTGTASIGALNVSSIGGFSPIQVRDAIIATSTIYASSLSASTLTVDLITTIKGINSELSNATTSNVVYYNSTTKQLTYGAISGGGSIGNAISVSSVTTSSLQFYNNVTNSSVEVSNDLLYVWNERETVRDWFCVASSADGTKLVAGALGGQLYTSTDSGITWIARESTRNWTSVASSADGTKLVASVVGGNLYTSTDSGVTWFPRSYDNNIRAWYSVASSIDGTKLIAAVLNEYLYTSTDSGITWSQHTIFQTWSCVASSADGTKLVAGVDNGVIYISNDSGITWSPRIIDKNRRWFGIASSYDGMKLVAIAYGDYIYISSDGGQNWQSRESQRYWFGVSMSADGKIITAVVYNGQIYISLDSGVTWKVNEYSRDWVKIASSADGIKLIAAVRGGKLYTTVGQGSINISSYTTINMRESSSINTVYYDIMSKELTYGAVQPVLSTFNSFSTGTASIGELKVSTIAGFSPIQVRDAIIATSTIYTSTLSAPLFTGISTMSASIKNVTNISLEWIKQLANMNTSQYDYFSNIVTDLLGNIYICYMTLYGTVSGGTATGNRDIVVCKLNTNGVIQWVKETNVFNTTGDDMYPVIASDNSGNVYVAYYTNGAISGGINYGQQDIVIIKFDTNGNLLWTSQSPIINTDTNDLTPFIAIDTSGNVYVTYYSAGTVSGGTNLSSQYDIVVAKFNTNGIVQWVVQPATLNTTSSEASGGIKVDSAGNIYISYYTQGGTVSGGVNTLNISSIVVAKLNNNGNIIWVRQTEAMNALANSFYPDLAIDSNGNVYVTYVTSGTVSGGERFFTVTNDVVVFKLNSDGNLQWIKQSKLFNTLYTDRGPRVAVGPSGNVYIAYTSSGTVSGGINNGGDGGYDDLIIFALDTNGNLIFTKQELVMNTIRDENYPSIAIDSNENIFVTYHLILTVSGGVNIGQTDIAVLKFTPNIVYNSINVVANSVNIPTINSSNISTNVVFASTIVLHDSFTTSKFVNSSFYPTYWTPRDLGRNWRAVASSSDGTKLVAVTGGGKIYTSTDSGVTWTPRAFDGNWNCVASSADGTKLVAVGTFILYTSTDSGLTWTLRNSSKDWAFVASSADGTKLVAAVAAEKIYTSTDSGVTWTARDSDRYWTSVASSADGTKLVACAISLIGGIGDKIYTSTDSGVTWTPRDSIRNWQAVASSSDGTKLVAAEGGGQIYTSIDSGVTWTPRASNKSWEVLASSADGTKLAACTYLDQIYLSSDSGLTWTAYEVNKFWTYIASSADGTKLVATSYNGPIYTVSITGSTTIDSYVSITNMLSTNTGTNVITYDTTTKELKYNTAKTFVIDHPTNPSRYLVHACLEGPESGVYYRGKSCIPNNSSSVIVRIPEYATTFGDFTIQVTPVWNGTPRTLNVSEMSADGTFTVYGEPGEFNWHVHGKRADIDVEPDKSTAIVSGSGPYKWIM